MTALPQPGRLLTIAEYAGLPDDDAHRWELLEGNLVMSPSPTPRHMIAVARLFAQLDAQLRKSLRAVPDIDIDLRLSAGRSNRVHPADRISLSSARPSSTASMLTAACSARRKQCSSSKSFPRVHAAPTR